MSFILDALKKSENDRQRQSGPALFEVRVAPPRSRFPPWAIAVVGLLLVNVAVIGWLMMRKPAVAAPAAQQAAVAQPAPSPQYAPQPQYAPPPQQYAPPPVQAPGAQPQGYPPPAGAPVPQQGAAFAPTEPPANTGQSVEPQLADSRAAESTNPDDYAPAAEADSSGALGHARRGTSSGLPTYEDAGPKLGVPPLRIDLHVYAPDPHKRFILLNMKRLGEGESLPEGVRVDSITTDGAILEYRGSKFVLDRD